MGHRSLVSTMRYLTPDMGGTNPVTIDLLARLETTEAAAQPAASPVVTVGGEVRS
jgi:hypothetical protein